MLLDKATGANAIVQDKYVTIYINKKSVEDARTYFADVYKRQPESNHYRYAGFFPG